AASEWFTKECIGSITTWDNMVEKFILKFHHLSDHDEEEETEEDDNPNETGNLNNVIAKGTEEPWWYDELADGKPMDETLALKAKIEGSWGDATPEVMKFCGWLKNSFENFHELDYEALGPYANMETEWTRHEEHKGNPNPEPSNCKIRRFEMMKYSFNDDEDYITIKESEHLNHSKDSLDAYRELLRLIDEGWVVTTPDE
ncbi:hypothetical protein Tco_1365478, partial [Tanacetum coccineum]